LPFDAADPSAHTPRHADRIGSHRTSTAPIPGCAADHGAPDPSESDSQSDDRRAEGADLRATDLTAADFTSARLDAVKLDLADLRGADFTDTDLAGVSLQGSVADDTTIWPVGFDPLPAGVRIGLAAAPPLRPQNWIQ